MRAALLPTVNGLGGYALARPDIGPGEAAWNDVWWLGLNLSWDFNLGGQQLAQSAEAMEAFRSLQMQRLHLADAIALQAKIARNDIEEAYTVYSIGKEELDIAGRRFELASEKQKVGRMTVNALLELEAELAQTEQQFEAARLQYFAAVTDYLYAVGSDALWGGL